MESNKKYFTTHLIAWHATENQRSLPWKSEKDPYKIWLSEVILQQTRALQGLPYYLAFTEAYPTVHDMAAANDDEVFRLWQGLGYYNRCKNMLATARYISKELGGVFPKTYEELLQLKGIGPYTAAAISSFAFGLPQAVVDGNVYRVLARYFGIDDPFDTTAGKIVFSTLAQELLDKKSSAAYNQAIMDFGAVVCTPRNPTCDECPLQKKCIAFHHKLIDILPVRSKKKTVRTRYFNYLLLKWQEKVWIQKRTSNDIWENLHQPYLVESTEPLTATTLSNNPQFIELGISADRIIYEGKTSQRLTHQIINSIFFSINLSKKPSMNSQTGMWLTASDLKNIAFPRTLVSFLKNNLYF
jgi:A/G-specific adenine glycosylase